MEEYRPYLKTDAELLLGTNLAHMVIKVNALIVEYEELRKGYMDLCKANDEHKQLLLELATQQKHQNTEGTGKRSPSAGPHLYSVFVSQGPSFL